MSADVDRTAEQWAAWAEAEGMPSAAAVWRQFAAERGYRDPDTLADEVAAMYRPPHDGRDLEYVATCATCREWFATRDGWEPRRAWAADHRDVTGHTGFDTADVPVREVNRQFDALVAAALETLPTGGERDQFRRRLARAIRST